MPPVAARRARGFAIRGLAVALATVLTLVAAELAVRGVAVWQSHRGLEAAFALPPPPVGATVTLGSLIRAARNPRVVYELRPDLDVVYAGARVTTDAEGFRQGPPTSGQAGVFRIIGIGDSVMFGQGVNDDEPYLAELGRLLNEWSPMRPVEIINTAAPGYNTAMEVAMLEDKGLRHQPDLVLIGLVENDLSLPNFIRPDPSTLSLRRSFLADSVAARFGRVVAWDSREDAVIPGWEAAWPDLAQASGGLAPTKATGEGAAFFENDPARVPSRYSDLVGWGAFHASLHRLSELAARDGFRVAAVSLQLFEDDFKREARATASRLGIPFIDAGSALLARKRELGVRWVGSVLSVSAADGHPSAEAHRIAAGVLFDGLRASGVVPVASERAPLESARR